MKLSLNWLKSLMPISLSTENLAHGLTMAGLEVEGIEFPFSHLDALRTGRIFDIAPHPNADKLRLCKVDTGDAVFNVVCGAPNIENGMIAPFAPAGVTMPDGEVLKKGKIRGEVSEGMLCSARELGLSDDHDGILPLALETRPGLSLTEALDIRDTVLAINITPNRGDCASVFGLAREVAALEGKSFTPRPVQLPAADTSQGHIKEQASVKIDYPEGCPRYTARLLTDIQVGPSPLWIRARLMAAGIRSINNIVDVTNYVMLETGQPLHAFDFDTLSGQGIRVRAAKTGEKFITLDEKERELQDGMILICDKEKPVAIGGIMGGLHSGVTATTTRVLIESASFDPVSVRKTQKVLGLSSDSGYRFERGVDPEGTLRALDQAASLMVLLGKGKLVEGFLDEHPVPYSPKILSLVTGFINERIGMAIPEQTMVELLQRIGFGVELSGETLRVAVPSFRPDVSIKEDLSEEVARLFGYDEIPVTFPAMPSKTRQSDDAEDFRHLLQDMVTGLGFHECMNYSFIPADSPDRLRLPENHPLRPAIHLKNPLSEEMSIMRTSLVPGLLATLSKNIAQQEKTLKFFETGQAFLPREGEDLPVEKETLILGMTGNRVRASWYARSEPMDFYDLKGCIENLLAKLKIPGVFAAPQDTEAVPWARKGACALIFSEKDFLGSLYEVHPETCRHFDIKQPVFLAELDMAALTAKKGVIRLEREIPRYPATLRDVTLILDKKIPAAELLNHVEAKRPDILESLGVHDLYQGENLPEGKKSLTLRMVYRSAEGSLTDKKVNKIQEKIVEGLLAAFNAKLPV